MYSDHGFIGSYCGLHGLHTWTSKKKNGLGTELEVS